MGRELLPTPKAATVKPSEKFFVFYGIYNILTTTFITVTLTLLLTTSPSKRCYHQDQTYHVFPKMAAVSTITLSPMHQNIQTCRLLVGKLDPENHFSKLNCINPL